MNEGKKSLDGDMRHKRQCAVTDASLDALAARLVSLLAFSFQVSALVLPCVAHPCLEVFRLLYEGGGASAQCCFALYG